MPFLCFTPFSDVVVPFPAPWGSVVMLVLVLKVTGAWSLSPGEL